MLFSCSSILLTIWPLRQVGCEVVGHLLTNASMLLIGIDHYEIKLFGIKIDKYCCPLGYAHFDAVEERSTYCCIRSEI